MSNTYLNNDKYFSGIDLEYQVGRYTTLNLCSQAWCRGIYIYI